LPKELKNVRRFQHGRCIIIFLKILKQHGFLCPLIGGGSYEKNYFAQSCIVLRFTSVFLGGMFNRGGAARDFGIQLPGAGILRL
jgi:hypothetical protein